MEGSRRAVDRDAQRRADAASPPRPAGGAPAATEVAAVPAAGGRHARLAPAGRLPQLLAQVRSCTLCAAHLAHGPRPVLQLDRHARILVTGQAPGRKVHASGVPFDDASGERLRHWLGIDRDAFYDARQVAILPIGLCYPGRGRSGDLPPRPECAATWRAALLAELPRIEMMLLVGRHALDWHLPAARTVPLAAAVAGWRAHWPQIVPLPHPSPRNNGWLKRHAWFERELLPALRERIGELLSRG